MSVDTAQNRAASVGVGRPYMRAQQPESSGSNLVTNGNMETGGDSETMPDGWNKMNAYFDGPGGAAGTSTTQSYSGLQSATFTTKPAELQTGFEGFFSDENISLTQGHDYLLSFEALFVAPPIGGVIDYSITASISGGAGPTTFAVQPKKFILDRDDRASWHFLSMTFTAPFTVTNAVVAFHNTGFWNPDTQWFIDEVHIQEGSHTPEWRACTGSGYVCEHGVNVDTDTTDMISDSNQGLVTSPDIDSSAVLGDGVNSPSEAQGEFPEVALPDIDSIQDLEGVKDWLRKFRFEMEEQNRDLHRDTAKIFDTELPNLSASITSAGGQPSYDMPIYSGMNFRSAGAGSSKFLQWDGGTIAWKGVVYEIEQGTSSANTWVYVDTDNLPSSGSYTLGQDASPSIQTNRWYVAFLDSSGNAYATSQSSLLNGGIIQKETVNVDNAMESGSLTSANVLVKGGHETSAQDWCTGVGVVDAQTSIHGSSITADSITTDKINFVVGDIGGVSSEGVVSAINASGEGLLIDADNLSISGDAVFDANYDPTDKLYSGYAGGEGSDGRYRKHGTGRAVLNLFPKPTTADTKALEILNEQGESVFTAWVGGSRSGDILIGDTSNHHKHIKWDDSAGKLEIFATLRAKDITDGTINADQIGKGEVTTTGTGSLVGASDALNLDVESAIAPVMKWVNLDSTYTCQVTGYFWNSHSSTSAEVDFYISGENMTTQTWKVTVPSESYAPFACHITEDMPGSVDTRRRIQPSLRFTLREGVSGWVYPTNVDISVTELRR